MTYDNRERLIIYSVGHKSFKEKPLSNMLANHEELKLALNKLK